MKVSELVELTGYNLLASGDGQFEFKDIYSCDLLSWVMAHAPNGSLWITHQNNINIVAIAALINIPCIILAEGLVIDEFTQKRAEEKGITILSAHETAYEIGRNLAKL